MDAGMNENLGGIVESGVFELLKKRFGRDCVYKSPKFADSGGEKEICDVLILALPYAIAFQVKWMQLTSDDLEGDKAEVKKERLMRRMRNAADQFAEICSTIEHAVNVELPMVWSPRPSDTFTLPMAKIEKVIPVVIVDFDDKNYCNPDRRYCDIPPVISDAGERVQRYGKVHSFLKKDFERIVAQLFTVGDLMLWLSEREKIFNSRPKTFVNYNELSMFSIYLAKYDLFRKIADIDGMFLEDVDLFERLLSEKSAEFERRRRVYGSPCVLDILELKMANVVSRNADASLVADYLEYIGRLRRLSCLERRTICDRLTKNLDSFASAVGQGSVRGSFYIGDHGTTSSTAFYFGVCDFTAEDANQWCEFGFVRAISFAASKQLSDRVKEVMVLFVRRDRPDCCCRLVPVQPGDWSNVLSEKELSDSQISASSGQSSTTEWEYADEICRRYRK